MSVIGNIVEKLICVKLTQSLVTRYVIISDSMVFLGLDFIERKKKWFSLSYYKLEKICHDDMWASVLGCGYNEVGI